MKVIQSTFALLVLMMLTACQTNYNKLKQIDQLLRQALQDKEKIDDFATARQLTDVYHRVDSLTQAFKFYFELEKRPKIQRQLAPTLEQSIDYLKQLQAYQSDASLYNLGAQLKIHLIQTGKNNKEKSQTIDSLLKQAPFYYQEAQQKLKSPNADQLRLAIRKQIAGLSFLEGELQDSIESYNSKTAISQEWHNSVDLARLALKDYIAWCNSQYLNEQ